MIVLTKTVNFNPIKNYDAVVLFCLWLNGCPNFFFQKTENNENFDSNPVCKMTVDSTCRPVIIRDLQYATLD